MFSEHGEEHGCVEPWNSKVLHNIKIEKSVIKIIYLGSNKTVLIKVSIMKRRQIMLLVGL